MKSNSRLKVRKITKVGFFITGEFLPELAPDWDQVSTNGLLYRVPGGI